MSDATETPALRAAIIQDSATHQVLMLGWMDDEALRRTIDSGEVHFWSRSRRRLWRKGETSGDVWKRVALQMDCDDDATLVTATPSGPVCHTGSVSCFRPYAPAPSAGAS